MVQEDQPQVLAQILREDARVVNSAPDHYRRSASALDPVPEAEFSGNDGAGIRHGLRARRRWRKDLAFRRQRQEG